MKKNLFLFLIFYSSLVFSQSGPFEVLKSCQGQARYAGLEWQNRLNLIFSHENDYWNQIEIRRKGSGYKPYNRFKYFWEKYNAIGINPADSWWDAYLNLQNRPATDNSNWSLVGETAYTHSGGTEGKGRINAIAVDPNNSDIIYIGAPAGGLWKTTDGGQTWIPLTDHLPSLGVSGIAIHPNDSNTILIGTGDDDAMVTPSKGIFKSIDGGQTWTLLGTGLSNGLDFISDIIINPANPDIILAASSVGILRSDNGGNSWSIALGGYSHSLRKHPANHNIYYAILEDEFYRSTDAGQTWTQITNGLPSASQTDRMVMDVTPASPNKVYVYSMAGSSSNGVFVSDDSGQSFTQTGESGNMVDSQQSWYDLALAVSDSNPAIIIKGELNLMRSTDGGDNFYTINDWATENDSYTHADIHFIRYFNGILYVGSDGGIYRSFDNGNHFENLNNGLAISQFYRISIAKGQSEPGILGGLQDNGGIAKIGSAWNIYHGADGMDNAIDQSNPQVGYSFIYFGWGAIKTTNGGLTGQNMPALPESGNWVTPMAMNANNELFAAAKHLFKFANNNWQQVTSSGFSSRIDVMEFHPVQSNVVYAGVGNKLYKSTNGGASFSLLHQFGLDISAIAIDPDSNDLWVATGSYVSYSHDGGNSWTNISTGLPSGVAVNDLQYHRFSNPATVYAATDIGVFRKEGANDWEVFSNQLPMVPVYDLELDEGTGYLFAGTHGRSVWKTPVTIYPPQTDLGIESVQVDNQIECNEIQEVTFTVKNYGSNPVTNFTYSYDINGQTGNPSWNGTLNYGETTDLTVTLNTPVQFGLVPINLTVNLINDQVSYNDQFHKTILVNKPESVPMQYDFESASHELLSFESGGQTSVWQRAIPSGSVLGSAASGSYAYCSNPSGNYSNGKTEYLYLPCLDFSGMNNLQIQFDLAFDIEQDWDALYVEYSTDGQVWHILGTSSDPSWYNSNTVNGVCPGAQWSGTDSNFQTYIHSLDFLAGEPQVYLRFVMASDTYVTGEGAVIDNLQITGNLAIENFETNLYVQVYPNPADAFVTVTSNEGIDKLEILDLSGKIIAGLRFNHLKEFKINTSKLTPGIYLFRIVSGDKVYNQQVIKK